MDVEIRSGSIASRFDAVDFKFPRGVHLGRRERDLTCKRAQDSLLSYA